MKPTMSNPTMVKPTKVKPVEANDGKARDHVSSKDVDDGVDRDISEPLETIVKMKPSGAPLNEFKENPRLLAGTFPTMFPLGLTSAMIGSTAGVSKLVKERLVKMYDQRFAQHIPLLLLMFDQHLRHCAAQQVGIRVGTNKKGIQDLSNKINSPNFDERLKKAAKD